MNVDPEQTVEKLQQQIEHLTRDLNRVRRERDEAQYRKEIAEWAVVGVVTSRVEFRMAQAPEAIAQTNDFLRIAELVGQHAAHALLHKARLAFSEHADFYALRQHVYYLENHARASGLAFTPWVETGATQAAFNQTRFAAWPIPKAFSQSTETKR